MKKTLWIMTAAILLIGCSSDTVKGQAVASLRKGQALLQSDGNEAARREFEKALEIFQSLDGEDAEVGKASSLTAIGNTYLRGGDYQKALENFGKVTALLDKCGNARSVDMWLIEVSSYSSIGLVYNYLGDYETALKYQQEAASLVADMKSSKAYSQQSSFQRFFTSTQADFAECCAYSNIGLIYRNLDQYEEALENFQKALRVLNTGRSNDRELRSNLNSQIGMTFLEMGAISEAEKYIVRSNNPTALGALCLAKQDYNGAIENFETGLLEARRTQDAGTLFASHTGVGLAHERLGNCTEATDHFREAIQLTEAIEDSISEEYGVHFLSSRIFGFSRAEAYGGLERTSDAKCGVLPLPTPTGFSTPVPSVHYWLARLEEAEKTRTSSPGNVHIVAFATLIAVLLTARVYWRQMVGVFYPYYRRGDCGQIGFIPLGVLLSRSPKSWFFAYRRFILPWFATAYLFVLMVLDHVLMPGIVHEEDYIYYMTGLWFLVILMTGQALPILLATGVPFGIGYLVSNSVYGGYVAVAIVLSILFARHFNSNFDLSLQIGRVEVETGRSLRGERLRRFKRIRRWIVSKRWPFVIIAVIFWLYTIIEHYDFFPGLALRAIPDASQSLVATLTLLPVFLNISLGFFVDISDYLQMDFFYEVGKILRLKREDLGEFRRQEAIIDEAMRGRDRNPLRTPLPIDPTDRISDLERTSINRLNAALYFFSLDALLTTASVLDTYVLPGLNLDQIYTLSSILKLPVAILFVARTGHRIMAHYASRMKLHRDSETFRTEMSSARRYYRDLDRMLRDIQHQQITDDRYINVHGNCYLLALAGSADVQTGGLQ